MIIFINMKSFFKNLRLRRKLFVSYILIAFLPMIIILIMAYNLMAQLITEDGIWSIDQVIGQINSSIAGNLSNLDAVSDFLYVNKDIQEFLSNSYYSYPAELETYLKVEKRLMEINESSKLSSVKIFSLDRNIYSQGSTGVFSLDMVKNRAWFKQKYGSENFDIFFEVPQAESLKKQKSFYMIRPMKEFRFGSRIIAFLQFEIPTAILDNSVKTTSIKKTGYIFFTDDKGNIISHKNDTLLGKNIKAVYNLEKIGVEEKNFIVKENGKKLQFIRRKMNLTGWVAYGVVPMGEVVEKINTIAKNIVLVLLLSIFFAIYISNRVAKTISKPILRLTDRMAEIREERFMPIPPLDREDEIGILYQSYNRMIFKIQQLIKEVYESDIKKREAEYKALKSQISPHFLYNTLDSIHWLAMRYKAREISTMVNLLAKFYRISISKGREYITLAEELQHAESYVKIQKIRYEEKFEVKFEINDKLLSYYTIGIITQPLVENAIIHGLERKDSQGIITIRLLAEEDDILIEVEDNGVGGDPGLIQQIVENGKAEARSGYGIINVNERVKLHFGGKYGLTYMHGHGQGIVARIRIPKINEEGMNDAQVNHC